MTTQKEESIETLRALCPVGSTIHTILEHCSPSGMTRWIKPVVIVNHWPHNISHDVAYALGWSRGGKHYGVKVNGCGMDMGFHLVYTLSSVLHGDGYAIKQEWL